MPGMMDGHGPIARKNYGPRAVPVNFARAFASLCP